MSVSTDIFDIAIEDYMSSIGYDVVKSSSKYLFFYSPFRNETKASFIIDRVKAKWQDPGYNMSIKERRVYKWHSLLDLVMELEKCDARSARNIILGTKINTGVPREPVLDVPSIEVVSENSLTDSYLIRYIESRNVNVDLAKMYCKQVGVIFPQSKKNSEKVYEYIGFKNDKEGWELRSSGMKISTSPKYYTRFLAIDDEACLFEGFFDFLSALTHYEIQQFDITTIILNSLVNVPYLTSSLSAKKNNHLFWDNDEAADIKINLLKEEGVPFNDLRKTVYPNYNDFNDFICNKKR